MKYILAIDQGTTGSRAIVYDKKGRKAAGAYEEFPQYFPRPGWVEHDPLEIWRSVEHSIRKVLRQVPAKEIAAVGITNQRETAVLWDRETLKPACRAIVWQCRRTAGRCDELKKRKGLAQAIKTRTGLPLDAYFSATKIEWMLSHSAGLKEKAGKGEIAFGTADSWVLARLTGGRSHATDYTNASRTMLFNIREMKWEKEFLKVFNIPDRILPEVRPSSGPFGLTAGTGGLPAGIPVLGMAGDQQAALFGQACFEPGTIKNTYGTGAFILLNTGKKAPVSQYGLITTLGAGPSGEPVYVLEGSIFIAGAAIQWLRDQLKIMTSASESGKMARAVPDNNGVYFVPALVGLGAPYWDSAARGSIYGITRGTNRNHLARSALEAMAYQTKDVLLAMEKDSGLRIRELKVDGGASANDFLCQFQADILGCSVIRPRVIETTSLGAAYLAGLAAGFWKKSGDIEKCRQEEKVFKPKMKRAVSRDLYAGWQRALRRTLEKNRHEKYL